MPDRPPQTHIIIVDGTLSRLSDGHETNAGLLYKLLLETGSGATQTVGYDRGVQGSGVMKWVHVAAGSTINQSILSGYATLASRYRPGDRIMLFGYSRGAYAVRSLAGMIGQIGLLKREHAMHRRVLRAFRYYQAETRSNHARVFTVKFCHRQVPIEMVGVWDTVGALGLPYPILSRLAPMATEFHDHNLGHNIRHAFHALALDETRTAYAPILWDPQPGWYGTQEQVWFAGVHGDVGGHIWPLSTDRGLSNIPFLWMLEKAEACGLHLPEDWRARFPTDPAARSIGNRAGWGKFFLLRRPRIAGAASGEAIHPSVSDRESALPRYRKRARWVG